MKTSSQSSVRGLEEIKTGVQSSSMPQLSDLRREPGRPSEVRQGEGLNSPKINEN